MKRSTPYFFCEPSTGGVLWLTAGEYRNLKAAMLQSVQDGRNPASRMEGFGPEPVEK